MKAVLLNSGGLDSALIAHKLKADGYEIYSVFVNAHCKNSEACRAAAKITADKYCVNHREIDLNFGYEPNYFVGEILMQLKNHAMVMFSLGVSYASHLGIDEVYAGSKANVTEAYADKYNEYANENRHTGVTRAKLVLPIWNKYDYQAVAEWAGADLADFDYPYSCRYSEPCMGCSKCIRRDYYVAVS